MNIHAPERGIGESWEDYKARRELSRAIVRKQTRGPSQERWILPTPPNWVHWWRGQHTNEVKSSRRNAIAVMGKRLYARLTKVSHQRKVDKCESY